MIMTIWESLVQRLHPKQEKRASYNFATPAFIEEFTKVAAAFDLSGDELEHELTKLDANHRQTKGS